MTTPGDRRLLVATHSAHKLEELRELLDLPGTQLISLADVGITIDAPEERETFDENAADKAIFYAALSGLPTLADDSGLEVDALGGGPGVRTRRYAGEDATDAENNAKLLRALRDVPEEGRSARYRCSLAYATVGAGVPPVLKQGACEGRIATELRGEGGFGYDPLFIPDDASARGRTLGEMTAAEKNRISHRAQAARLMGEHLREAGW